MFLVHHTKSSKMAVILGEMYCKDIHRMNLLGNFINEINNLRYHFIYKNGSILGKTA